MSKDETKDLEKFLQPFDKEITDLVFWLREFVWDLYPKANELIYDNYNAVAFGWSVTDRLGHTFCSIAVGRTSKNIHFGFYWGNEINDPEKLLQQAHTNSLAKVKDPKQLVQGLTITKSISAAKRTLKNKPVKKNK